MEGFFSPHCCRKSSELEEDVPDPEPEFTQNLSDSHRSVEVVPAEDSLRSPSVLETEKFLSPVEKEIPPPTMPVLRPQSPVNRKQILMEAEDWTIISVGDVVHGGERLSGGRS